MYQEALYFCLRCSELDFFPCPQETARATEGRQTRRFGRLLPCRFSNTACPTKQNTRKKKRKKGTEPRGCKSSCCFRCSSVVCVLCAPKFPFQKHGFVVSKAVLSYHLSLNKIAPPPPPRSSIYKIPSSDPHDPRLGLGLGRRRRSGIGRGRGAVVVAVVGPVVVEAVEEADEEVGDVGVREVAGVGGNGCWFVCVND